MQRYVLKRLLQMILVLLGVLLFVFILSRCSGDPIPMIIGENYTQEQYDEMYVKLGYDKPYVVQYFNYVKGVVTKLDLGTSYESKTSVSHEVVTRFPISFKLAIIALLWSSVFGVLFGVISAVRQYSAADYAITSVAMIQASMPMFWVGMMLVIIFSLKLKLVPASGLDYWYSYILPCISLGTSSVAHTCRMTRSSMLEVVRQDYIRTARSKGLAEKIVIFSHAFPNAAVPIVTHIGNLMAVTVGSTAVVESVFNIPGLGSYLVNAIGVSDYPAVQGSVLAFSVFVCVLNFVVDMLYGAIDPRIKAKYMAAGGNIRKVKRQIREEVEGKES